jgi:hypothetical protein
MPASMKLLAAAVGLAPWLMLAGGTARGSDGAAPVALVSCKSFVVPAPRAPDTRYRTMLGILAVPPKYLPGRGVPVQEPGLRGTWYWRKAPIFVHSGKFTVTISVPEAWRTRAAITWGGAGYVSLRFSGCGTGSTNWSLYTGGFYTRHTSACVPLVVRRGTRSVTVRFGIGRRCP